MASDSRRRLSVVLATYNHERYVRKALQSLFAQEFEDPIELVVADDGSSDRTVEVIREYQGADQRFRFVAPPGPAHVGVTANYGRAFAACTGDYVAVLEGDDYWINPRKLQRQFDFLESHWECDLCAVNYFMFEEDRARFTSLAPIGTGHRFLDAQAMVIDNPVGNFSACMYRKTALDALPSELFRMESYDWIINICVARTSLIGFLNEPMSVYRRHVGGVWTQKSDIEKLTRQLELIPAYDALTDGLFHAEFEALESRLRYTIKARTTTREARIIVPALRLLMDTCPRSRRLPDFMPPVMVALGRAVVPPAVKRRFARLVDESRPS